MGSPSVLFINRVYPPERGATGRVLRDLAQAFAREGWDVRVIAAGREAGRAYDGEVEIRRIRGADRPGNAFSYALIWVRLLAAALRAPRADLVVTLSDPPMLVVAGHVLKAVKKSRHIHWCHDLYPDLFPVLGVRLPVPVIGALRRLGRACMRKADRVVVIGRCMARRLAKDGFQARQISLIPNWPDAELMQGVRQKVPYAPGDVPQGDYDDVLNGYRSHDQQVKHGPKFRVLYAGNVGRAHPVGTVLDAAELLQAQYPEIEFVFVGDGPRYDEIARERTARELDNVRLLPYQPVERLKDLMESGDLHIISVKDGAAGMLVPVKLYAALAAHRPCILLGAARTETGRVITEFGAGVVVAHGDAARLAEEIRLMRMDSDRWFAAYEGAKAASQVFVPGEAIRAWLERARRIVSQDLVSKPAMEQHLKHDRTSEI